MSAIAFEFSTCYWRQPSRLACPSVTLRRHFEHSRGMWTSVSCGFLSQANACLALVIGVTLRTCTMCPDVYVKRPRSAIFSSTDEVAVPSDILPVSHSATKEVSTPSSGSVGVFTVVLTSASNEELAKRQVADLSLRRVASGLVSVPDDNDLTVLRNRAQRCSSLMVSIHVKASPNRARGATHVLRTNVPRGVPSRSCPLSARWMLHGPSTS